VPVLEPPVLELPELELPESVVFDPGFDALDADPPLSPVPEPAPSAEPADFRESVV
jgi:hypothetical protein